MSFKSTYEKKPAEPDFVAAVPGYTGQAAKIYSRRDAAGSLQDLEVFDLLGHSKMTGDAQAVVAWLETWLAQEAANRQARRTQLQAQLFTCKLVDEEKVLFLDAQRAVAAALKQAGLHSRAVAATSGSPRRSLGPATKRR